MYVFKHKERQLTPLKSGDKVIAKHKNTRFYLADVLDYRDQIFYEVDFDDGSFSKDLYPEDIHVGVFTTVVCYFYYGFLLQKYLFIKRLFKRDA